MTSPAPIPTERLEEMPGAVYEAIHRAAIDAYEAATPPDYRYSALALRKAVDAALSLRQQAQPTREEGWRVKELEWTPENWWPGIDGFEARTELGLSYAVTGSDDSGWTAIRRYDAQTERFDTLDGAKAWCQADYASRISSALLPIDAPAHEGGGEPEAVMLLRGPLSKRAASAEFNEWQALEVVAYIDRLKAASPAEPAVHSLQTEWVMVPKSALDWLHGSGPDANGKWFGEVEEAFPTIKALNDRRPPFWWRSHFRKLMGDAAPKP